MIKMFYSLLDKMNNRRLYGICTGLQTMTEYDMMA